MQQLQDKILLLFKNIGINQIVLFLLILLILLKIKSTFINKRSHLQ